KSPQIPEASPSFLELPQPSTELEDLVSGIAIDPVASEQPRLAEDHNRGTGTEFTDPPETAPSSIQLSWLNVIGIVWLGGSLIWATVAAVRIGRFCRLIRQASPVEAKLEARVRWLADRLGLSIGPAVRLVGAPVPPLLWALTRTPQLLIPSHL